MVGDPRLAAGQAGSHEDLVTQHAALVERIAYRLVRRMPPNVDVNDLMQAGMVGLLEAARSFVPTKGANLSTFAGIRIRGAMLDQVRELDWTPRSVHRRFRELGEAARRVEARSGRDARDAEVAAEMGVSLEDYHRVLQDAAGCRLFSLDELEDPDDGAEVPDRDDHDPLDELAAANFQQTLATAIDSLPERERLVMSWYYDDELKMREISELLKVSETRVRQIRGRALERLRARLRRLEG